MKILIVDDEAHARARLRSLIDEIGPPWRVVGEADNGQDALQRVRLGEVDLVLMDIRMPGMDGLEAAAVLAGLATPPAVIFVTAYDEHALAAFERHAVDYLLKPIRRERLQRAIEKAVTLNRPQLQALQALQEQPDDAYISVSFRGGLQRIPISEVIYFQADNKYVTVCHAAGEALLEESLKSLEERFAQRLIRIHRNALIVRERLLGLKRLGNGACAVSLAGSAAELEVSRRHLPEVRKLLRGRI
ncbi:LytTR family DNA-binding domain-containing protein [Sedimenticola selenatireducens]|uniref:DNA-binding response regulator n=1 Tax=Sedimenticola selenatireducens TaxID=191960 RepID=A0A2N6CUE8_9GAMM|nr:LytTR family DNA-binding domain-containing protein [Sedimenticola selenatireducens]PLX60793.1 MAG: DNA-binding response regulator [Sedimenticola selenatireducens]